MPEPTLRLTFEDMILRVAEYLGVADVDSTTGVAAVPANAHDLEVCKRLVNDGYRRFYNSHPRWNWTNRIWTLTFDTAGTGPNNVGGDNWRYYMPDGFYGHVIGKFTYAENSGHVDIVEAPEQVIRGNYASGDQSGYPNLFAIRPLSGEDRRQWEIIFWPKPAAADTVTGRIRIYPNEMVELTDVPNAGLQFDEAILAAAKAEAERERQDTQGIMESQWAEVLTRAVASDQQTTPTKLGDYGPGGRGAPSRAYTGVDTYTNQDGTIHSC